eukprot:3018464-Karenia_brevis.AAC.1
MSHHTLDHLTLLLRMFWNTVGEIPGLYKYLMQADIDSAFRRVPIWPGHRWACCMTFLHNQQ